MARGRVQLGSGQIDDIGTICSIGADKLRHLADTLEAGPITIERKLLEDTFKRELGEEAGTALLRFLLGAATLLRQRKPGLEEIMKTLARAALRAQDEDERLKSWPDCEGAISRLLNSSSVKLTAKALDVSYDFERVYLTGRLLTSWRPVFDDDRSAIIGGAVVQTMRLEYFSSANEQSSISIAMDRSDIQQLILSCEDALRKADAIIREARELWRKPTIMPGEDRQ